MWAKGSDFWVRCYQRQVGQVPSLLGTELGRGCNPEDRGTGVGARRDRFDQLDRW